MHAYSLHVPFQLILLLFVDKDERESAKEEKAFPGTEKEPSENFSNEEQKDDNKEETQEDSAPSAEDYTSQSDDDTEGNV